MNVVETARTLVKNMYELPASEPVSVELLSIYPRLNNNIEKEYEFMVKFNHKTEWIDYGYVTKFVTFSVRDEY